METNRLKSMDKNIYIKILLPVMLVITSLSGFCQNKKINVIILLDKSLSVNYRSGNPAVKSIIQNEINHINDEGDTYTMFYVHSNTLGATAAIKYIVKPKPLQPASMSMLNYNKLKQNWGKDLIRDKQARIQETEHYVFSNGASKTDKATDLWAIFEKLSTTCVPSSTNNILIFSDMIESMKGNGRRLKLDPTSRMQAISWAKVDKKIINATFSVNERNLKNATVQVVLPYEALASTFNANVRYYWEELFRLYGMKVSFI